MNRDTKKYINSDVLEKKIIEIVSMYLISMVSEEKYQLLGYVIELTLPELG